MTKRNDPYDRMTDEEFDDHVADLFAEPPRERLVPVSLRMPEHLLARTKAAAEAAGVPYQSLIKKAVDRVVTQLERRPANSR